MSTVKYLRRASEPLAELVACGMFQLDMTVRWISEPMAHVYGLDADTATGGDWYTLVPAAEHLRPLHARVLAGEPAELEVRAGARSFEMFLRPARDEDGAVDGMLVVLREVTRERVAEAALQRTLEGLEQTVERRTEALGAANRDLEAFVYTLSHDLRAPLRSITGMGALLTEDYGHLLPPAGLDYAERIISAAARMSSIMDSLLAFSLARGAPVPLAPAPLLEIVQAAVDAVPGAAACTTIVEPMPEILTERWLLGDVAQNLIENAMNYVAPGVAPNVRVSAERVGDRVHLLLEDNGVGIPPDQQELVFQPFERLGAVDTPGSGIGLATVRRIVQRIDGLVGVRPAVGGGSCFWLDLPAGAPPHPPA